MSKPTRLLRRIVISLIGFPIVAIGIILIPLPGPGILVCLGGFAVLSLEFDWAQRYVDRGKSEIRKIMATAKTKSDKYADKKDPEK